MTLRLEGVRLVRPDFSLSADFTVPKGEITAIIGPSGSGKSTLLSLIAGFETPAQGRILFEERDLTDVPPADRPVSLVFQDNNLFPHLSVERNVGLGLDPGLRLGAEDRACVARALEEVGLSGLAQRKPGALSGGQQSRAALARALLRDKPLLLLDEAFAALGPALRRDMLALVEGLRARHELSVLMVTHDPGDAAAIAPHTIFVDGGVAHAPAPTAALLEAPSGALAAYLGD
ncbi:thiamine ABC transporter ATP-binding protein [Oceanibium sediminis]|uniref:thiamine ABC transporter ATP-binding protein n=1 Tax=Oceanibium sediminis TaxID=2026339 RepID=UPI000DD4DDE8|nr:ATP-binding cassette domain-containing protein [Oceanibium sediminis]